MNSAALAKACRSEAAAIAALEAIMWRGKPACPHCGSKRVGRLTTRRGLFKCYHCRRQFSARTGTVLAQSNLTLHKWFEAGRIVCGSRRPVTDLHVKLGITLKTASRIANVLREAKGPPVAEMKRLFERDRKERKARLGL